MNLYVSQDATAVLEELRSLLSAEGDGQYLKLNRNGMDSGLMPVSIERIATFDGGDEVISVAHYYEQNGDLMADPLMEFLRQVDEKGNFAYIAIRFKQDGGFARDQQVVLLNEETGVPERYAKKQAHDAKVFTSQWMRNIAWQQKLGVKLKQKAQ